MIVEERWALQINMAPLIWRDDELYKQSVCCECMANSQSAGQSYDERGTGGGGREH